jgi:hypothetical protein
MPLQRDNDQERAAVIDRLLQQQGRRRPMRAEVKASAGKLNSGAARPQVERRQHRSEKELRSQREEMKREWDAKHGRKTHRRSA